MKQWLPKFKRSGWTTPGLRLNNALSSRANRLVSGPVELTQRRVFILPTQRGLGMVFTILLLLLVAFIYSNNLVYLLGFLLASIFFVTILHTFKALAGLVVQAGFVQPVFAGEAAAFAVTVTNPGNQPRLGLSATLETEQHFSLAADESRTLTLYGVTRKRGWQMIGTVTLASCYPLGSFRAWSALRFDSKVLVYPKPSAFSLPFPVGEGQQPSGQLHTGRSGRDDFEGIRSYQAGDPLRQIHWKAYAKGQGLLSKQYATDAGRARSCGWITGTLPEPMSKNGSVSCAAGLSMPKMPVCAMAC